MIIAATRVTGQRVEARASTPGGMASSADDEEKAIAAAEQHNVEVSVATDADFGIQEGEAEELTRKWVTWSEDLEENKRLVIQDDFEMTSSAAAATAPSSPRWSGVRRRRRVTPLDLAIANGCPVFYGWVIAGLVAVSALFISPAQVYCVGAVLDAIQYDLNLSREQISGLYGMSLLMAAPVIMLEGRAVELVSRRLLAALCALVFCVGCMLLSGVGGQISLLFVWTLLQVAGPGMLYPCGVSALQQWWREKLGRVQARDPIATPSRGPLPRPPPSRPPLTTPSRARRAANATSAPAQCCTRTPSF